MAKSKSKTSEVENRLIGETAKLVYDPNKHRAMLAKSQPVEPPENPTTPTEKAKTEKTKKPKAKGAAKTEKTEKEAKPPKPALKEIEQKVLTFLKTLDHPATINEIRDQFGFPLRAPARRIFRKLQELGYGENRRVGNKYLFHVKGKKYPKPKVEPPKAETTKEK